MDDNLLPYSTVPLHPTETTAASPNYTADSFDSFIVALPDKIYYPADAIEAFSKRAEGWLAQERGPEQEPLQLRRYFITTVSKLREHSPGTPVASGRHPRGADDASGNGSIRLGCGVLQRRSMASRTRCREGDRRRHGEPKGSGPHLAAP